MGNYYPLGTVSSGEGEKSLEVMVVMVVMVAKQRECTIVPLNCTLNG